MFSIPFISLIISNIHFIVCSPWGAKSHYFYCLLAFSYDRLFAHTVEIFSNSLVRLVLWRKFLCPGSYNYRAVPLILAFCFASVAVVLGTELRLSMCCPTSHTPGLLNCFLCGSKSPKIVENQYLCELFSFGYSQAVLTRCVNPDPTSMYGICSE